MCGIAGIVWDKPLEGLDPANRMIKQLHHRGPDDRGSISISNEAHGIALASTRLAIIDLSSAGHMPMVDTATGNVIVHNGEIYNFREIRKELERSGYKFISGTDTEVILKAYRRWGQKSLSFFRGMFAFAIWDAHSHDLLLARDRLGKKPLYYFHGSSGMFLFASEIRSLLASGYVEHRLDRLSLETFLFNGFVVSPFTIVEGVRSLMPGHWLRVNANGRIIESRRYWSIPLQPEGNQEKKTEPSLYDQVSAQLEEAVKIRLVSDVPLGVFLSGGLDSSVIVALMANSQQDIRTFSIGFDEPAYDESQYARWVAEHFGTRHTEIRLTKSDFTTWLPSALAAMDQPSFDGINTYCVSRAAKESGLTVALSGLGSDEVFGGYPFFKALPWLSKLARVARFSPHAAKSWAEGALRSHGFHVSGFWKALELICDRNELPAHLVPLAAYQTAQLHYPKWCRQKLLRDSLKLTDAQPWFGLPVQFVQFLEQEMRENPEENLSSLYALRLFLGERCLRDTDTMSMGVSLEVRAPFTDHLFLESICRIPARIRCCGAPNKPFQWAVFKSLLSDKYPLRKKRGFIFPFEDWLRDRAFVDQMTDLLTGENLCERIGLRPQTIKNLIKAFLDHDSGVSWSRIWNLFVLFHWCDRNRVIL